MLKHLNTPPRSQNYTVNIPIVGSLLTIQTVKIIFECKTFRGPALGLASRKVMSAVCSETSVQEERRVFLHTLAFEWRCGVLSPHKQNPNVPQGSIIAAVAAEREAECVYLLASPSL